MNRTTKYGRTARRTKANPSRGRPPAKGRSFLKEPGEFYGIFLFFLALLAGISLFSERAGVLGKWIDEGLTISFGRGAYFVPVLLFVWALSFFAHTPRYSFKSLILGLALTFVSLLALAGIIGAEPGTIFEQSQMAARGGYVGATLAYLLIKTVGEIGGSLFLIVLILIAFLISTRMSIKEVGQRVTQKSLPRIKETLKVGIKGWKKEEAKESPPLIKETYPGTGLTVTDVVHKLPAEEQVTEQRITVRKPREEETQKEQKVEEQLEIPLPRYLDEQGYSLPPLSILKRSKTISPQLSVQNVQESMAILQTVFQDFRVDARVTEVTRGPAVTLFELQLAPGVKVQRILNLMDDLCVALASPDIRILTPIPGRSAVGIEVPNKIRGIVTLGDIFNSPDDQRNRPLLELPLGKHLSGHAVYINVAEMPHVLIAGATGSGKSTCLNSLVTSLLFKAGPSQVKLILIDPKMVELSVFNGIPHLLTEVIVDPKKASAVLKWAVREMEERFKLLAKTGFKSLDPFNQALVEGTIDQESLDEPLEPLPYILVIIDELADLMMISSAEVEDSICRLSQMARAVGMHLVIATQRPSVNVITGLIKANIPSRIAFEVTSITDSRVILDMAGAEKLVGRGDMLFLATGSSKPIRVQGAFVTQNEIEMVVNYVKKQVKPRYRQEIYAESTDDSGASPFKDELLDRAIETVIMAGHASASLLQRRFRIGYARAGRLIDMMEDRGIVSAYEGSKPRTVLITMEEWERMQERRREEGKE